MHPPSLRLWISYVMLDIPPSWQIAGMFWVQSWSATWEGSNGEQVGTPRQTDLSVLGTNAEYYQKL